MGLFDVFNKKECSVCGGEIGLLGNRKLEDGNLCKECAKKLSPFFAERRHSTVDEIKEQLAYREENEGVFARFNTTKQYGSSQILRIDESKRQFTVSYSMDKITPDVISFDQVTGCTMDIADNKTELKRDGANGEKISYSPPQYLHKYLFRLRITVNHPYFDDVNFQLNSQPVEISDLDNRNNVGSSGGLLGALLGSVVQPITDIKYNQYAEQCNEIIGILNSKDTKESEPSDSMTGTADFYTQYRDGTVVLETKVTCGFTYSYKITNKQIFDINESVSGMPTVQAIEKSLSSMAEMELTKYFEDGGINAEVLQNPPAAASAAILAHAGKVVPNLHGIELTSFNITSMTMPEKDSALMSSLINTVSAAEWVCEYCDTVNSGKFCSGCGSKRQ